MTATRSASTGSCGATTTGTTPRPLVQRIGPTVAVGATPIDAVPTKSPDRLPGDTGTRAIT